MSKAVITRLIVLGMMLFIMSACKQVDDQPKEGIYPWQVTLQADGKTQVFGITLGESTLNFARDLWGRDYNLGLFETSNQPLSLEAYFNEVTLGGISGKFILILDATQDELLALQQNAIKRKVLGSGAKQYTLTAETTNVLAQKRIESLSYIPYVNLDEEIIRKRFGEPAERIIIDQNTQHLLFPELGLDLLLDEEGKEFLQYVVPAKFEQLRQTLLEKYNR